MLSKILTICVLLLFVSQVQAQLYDEESRKWNEPVKPFKIIGNVYYVGAHEVSLHKNLMRRRCFPQRRKGAAAFLRGFLCVFAPLRENNSSAGTARCDLSTFCAKPYGSTRRRHDELLKDLPCDVFLAPHGSFFSLHEKAKTQS